MKRLDLKSFQTLVQGPAQAAYFQNNKENYKWWIQGIIYSAVRMIGSRYFDIRGRDSFALIIYFLYLNEAAIYKDLFKENCGPYSKQSNHRYHRKVIAVGKNKSCPSRNPVCFSVNGCKNRGVYWIRICFDSAKIMLFPARQTTIFIYSTYNRIVVNELSCT